VAVPIGDELRADLASGVASLRAHPGAERDWRWTDADGWHLTLAFLGATDQADVPSMEAALARAVTDIGSFEVTTGGLGAFPSPGRARVLWYGVADQERRLRGVAQQVRRALGADAGAPFRAHLTLARSRPRDGVDARPLLGAPMPAGRIEVQSVVLFRSHLGRGPAHYERLFSAELGAQTPMLTR
jgi:2'-5' RNA ligase